MEVTCVRHAYFLSFELVYWGGCLYYRFVCIVWFAFRLTTSCRQNLETRSMTIVCNIYTYRTGLVVCPISRQTASAVKSVEALNCLEMTYLLALPLFALSDSKYFSISLSR